MPWEASGSWRPCNRLCKNPAPNAVRQKSFQLFQLLTSQGTAPRLLPEAALRRGESQCAGSCGQGGRQRNPSACSSAPCRLSERIPPPLCPTPVEFSGRPTRWLEEALGSRRKLAGWSQGLPVLSQPLPAAPLAITGRRRHSDSRVT